MIGRRNRWQSTFSASHVLGRTSGGVRSTPQGELTAAIGGRRGAQGRREVFRTVWQIDELVGAGVFVGEHRCGDVDVKHATCEGVGDGFTGVAM